jgi:hypothetical protein
MGGAIGDILTNNFTISIMRNKYILETDNNIMAIRKLFFGACDSSFYSCIFLPKDGQQTQSVKQQ